MKIGFIGLGIMGKPMAKNLVKAGHELFVYDVVAESLNDLTAEGARACASVREVAENARLIMLMLPDSPHVRDVVCGENGILAAAGDGSLVVDMSSITPVAAKEVAGILAEKSIRYMDAPVSGGEAKAIDGSLVIMAGGSRKDFDEVEPMLKAMGTGVTYSGEVGSGNMFKLANQIIAALNMAALSEAFTLAAKAGVDPALLFDGIKGGAAGSSMMNMKIPNILNRNFKPGFKIDLMFKDISNAMETAKSLGVPMLLLPQIQQVLQAVRQDGGGGLDHSAMINFYEKLANQEVKGE